QGAGSQGCAGRPDPDRGAGHSLGESQDRKGGSRRVRERMRVLLRRADPMRASGGPGSIILGRLPTRGESKMTQPGGPAPTAAALDYDSTIIGALEMSDKKWVLAVQLPGVKRHTRNVLEASGEELASLLKRLKARCAEAGHPIARVILTHEAGRDGFWLARFLVRRGVEVHVMQPSSLPVDRRGRGGERAVSRRRE